MSDYRLIRGYPGYDSNEDATDVRSYWHNGAGGTSSEPTRSIKAQQKGAVVYYALRRNGRTVMLKRQAIRDLAWGSGRATKTTMRQKQLTSIRRDAILETAKEESSTVHMMADALQQGVKQRRSARFSTSDALEVLGAIGIMLQEAP